MKLYSEKNYPYLDQIGFWNQIYVTDQIYFRNITYIHKKKISVIQKYRKQNRDINFPPSFHTRKAQKLSYLLTYHFRPRWDMGHRQFAAIFLCPLQCTEPAFPPALMLPSSSMLLLVSFFFSCQVVFSVGQLREFYLVAIPNTCPSQFVFS